MEVKEIIKPKHGSLLSDIDIKAIQAVNTLGYHSVEGLLSVLERDSNSYSCYEDWVWYVRAGVSTQEGKRYNIEEVKVLRGAKVPSNNSKYYYTLLCDSGEVLDTLIRGVDNRTYLKIGCSDYLIGGGSYITPTKLLTSPIRALTIPALDATIYGSTSSVSTKGVETVLNAIVAYIGDYKTLEITVDRVLEVRDAVD